MSYVHGHVPRACAKVNGKLRDDIDSCILTFAAGATAIAVFACRTPNNSNVVAGIANAMIPRLMLHSLLSRLQHLIPVPAFSRSLHVIFSH